MHALQEEGEERERERERERGKMLTCGSIDITLFDIRDDTLMFSMASVLF